MKDSHCVNKPMQTGGNQPALHPASWRASLISLAVFFLMTVLSVMASSLGLGEESRKVLVLNSYHKGYAWSDKIVKGVESVFVVDDNIELYVEYMDTKRHFSSSYLSQLRDIYAEKFSAEKFELIISSDDNAFDFLLANRDDLFPSVPIVFCGVNDFQDARIAGHEGITGVNESPDFAGNVELILKLHPDTRRIAVISDQTMTGKANTMRFRRITPDFVDKVEFVYFTDKTVSELRESLRSLPGDTVGLELSFYKDREGRSLSFKESAKLIAKSCNFPVYNSWDFMLVNGILGGKMTSGFEQGRTAAEMAQRILRGVPVDMVPIVLESPNVYMFDWNAMRRFGLRASDLPKGSVIINRPVSFFARYAGYICGTFALVVLQALLILRLLYSRRMRKRAQKSLRDHIGLLRVLIDTIPNPFFYKDRNGVYKACNKAFAEQIMRLPRDEIIGRSLHDLPNVVPGDLADEHAGHDELLFEEAGARTYEGQALCADGERREFLISKATFKDAPGHAAGLVGIMQDVSELRRAERESAFLGSVTQQVTDAILVTDTDHRITYGNSALEKLYGYAKEELLGETPDLLNAEPLTEEIQRDIYETVSSGKTWLGSHLNRRKDGTTFICEMKISPLRDEDGEVHCYVGILRDVTERVRARKALRVQRDLGVTLSKTASVQQTLEQLLAAVLQLDGVDCGGIYLVDSSTGGLDLVHHRELSARFVETSSYYGLDDPSTKLVMKGEAVYRSYPELLTGMDETKLAEGLRAIAVVPIQHEGQTIALLNVSTHDSDEIPPSTRQTIETIAAHTGDVVARVRAEAELRQSEDQYRCIFNSVSNGLLVFDLEGRIVSANPAACRMYGYSLDKLTSLSGKDIVHPAYLHVFEKFLSHPATEGEFHAESVDIRADGSEINVEITGASF
ncbi:PAS domain S-box protein, partial [bacterium]|nr:PAS domain S-box protein [bacterium]